MEENLNSIDRDIAVNLYKDLMNALIESGVPLP
jgi:hypothetical protein